MGELSNRDRFYNKCLYHGTPIVFCKKTGSTHDGYECTFRRCRQFLDDCLNKHPDCKEPMAGGRFASICPTRLIDVGSDTVPARLVKLDSLELVKQTSRSARFPGYVTLSYCWGPKRGEPHLLREDNENSFMRALPVLPKTIQDAVIVCRRMGVKYLWVDAVCILQGQSAASSDWERESTRVGSYYANALFTIAASWASASSEGCIPSKSYKYLAKRILSEDFDDWYDAKMAMQDSELMARGWVLQELFLSARILWFKSNEVVWTCNYGMATGILWHDFVPVIGELKKSKPNWYSIMEYYSTSSLSLIEDRLPALSGLCKYLDPEGNDKYLAGIWRSSLPQGLAWSPVAALSSQQVLSSQQAVSKSGLPSWSPLSTTHAVHFWEVTCATNDGCEFCGPGKLRLVDADVCLSYNDPHGRIQSAVLCVSASIYRVEIKEPYGFHFHFDFDSSASVFGTFYEDSGLESPSTGARQTQVILLGHHLYQGCPFFMVLEPANEAETYRRIGVFKPSERAYVGLLLKVLEEGRDRKQIKLV